MARVCIDAGFLIGLYDASDEHHQTAKSQFADIFSLPARNILVAPWPILYESLGTRYARNSAKKVLLEAHWSSLNRNGQLLLLDDFPFRERALEEHFEDNRRPLSLVDRILRTMVCDTNRCFDSLLTYNGRDFRDACISSGVKLIDQFN